MRARSAAWGTSREIENSPSSAEMVWESGWEAKLAPKAKKAGVIRGCCSFVPDPEITVYLQSQVLAKYRAFPART